MDSKGIRYRWEGRFIKQVSKGLSGVVRRDKGVFLVKVLSTQRLSDCTRVARARPRIAIAAVTKLAESRLPLLGIKGINKNNKEAWK